MMGSAPPPLMQRPAPWAKIVRLVLHTLEDAGCRELVIREKSADVADYLIYEQEQGIYEQERANG